MKLSMFRRSIFIVIFLLIPIACNNQIETDENTLANATTSPTAINKLDTRPTPKADECIASFETFAYNVPEWDMSEDLGKIYPPFPWKIEAVIPVLPPEDYWGNSNGGVIDVHNSDDGIEIWLVGFVWEDVFSYTKYYLIYKPETKEWIIMLGEIEDTGERVDWIFRSSDKTVWGLSIFEDDKKNLLSKFNEEKKVFELVHEVSDITIEQNRFLYDHVRDIFWIFVTGDAIYSYDPNTLETKRHVDLLGKQVGHLNLAPDGSIYFQRFFMEIEFQEEEILRFSPISGNITPLKIPNEPWPSGPGMFADRSGNLWFGVISWRETNGRWHLLHPDPDGYDENIYTNPYWASPPIAFESSNGVLWLRKDFDLGSDGMAWYDPKTGEGCWFTTEPSNIGEDQNRNLWMVVYGKLYKYPLNP